MKHLILLILSFCLIFPANLIAAERPNIVFILADDLPYAALTSHGETEQVPTPHIDSLARSGVRFSQASVAVPVCSPSRAAILTACHPQRWGHEFNPGGEEQDAAWFGVPKERELLVRPLHEAGYATALIGKWHLGSAPGFHPMDRGFSEFYGVLTGGTSYLKRVPNNPLYRGREVASDEGYLTDLFTREAVGFITRHKEKPFFLYLPYTAVHGPLQPDEARLAKLSHIEDELKRARAAMLLSLDEGVGLVLAALREQGIEKNTLVIFSTDNGMGGFLPNGAAGRFNGRKSSIYEGGLRVPLFMRWPGKFDQGKAFDAPVSMMDILPTCLDAAGLTDRIRQPVDGVSLMPLLTSASQAEPHAELFWRYSPQSAVRQGHWKLLKETPEAQPLLFDLANDPGERKDLAATQPEKIRELSAKLAAWEKQMQPAKWKFKTRGDDNFSPDKEPYKSPLLLREEAMKDGTPSAPKAPAPPPKPKASPTAFKDAAWIWHMDAESKLQAVGAAKLGIPLAECSDGFAAQLDGGHLLLPDLGDVFDHGEYTLHLRVKPAGETLDGSLFSSWAGKEHMPVDFSAWRMSWGHLSTQGISFRTSFKRSVAAGQAAVLDFYCPTPKPLTGWLDLTVRLESGVLDLFVNGELLFRNAEKLPGGLPFEFFLHETPGAIIGAQPGGRWPFRGLVDHVAIWRKSLSDAEVLELAGLKADGAELKPKRLHTKDALGQYHLPSDTPDEQRAALTNEELKKAIAYQIEHDPWYPQYHMALVGLVCNLHSLYHEGKHHYMLIHRGEALNHNEVFRHLVSDDLITWDIRPAPLGWPHPIWPNGTFIIGPDGKPSIVGGYPITLATAEDANLDVWKVRNDEVRITKEHPNYISDPKAKPGKYSWEEGNAWKQGDDYFMVGAGSHWDRINEQGKLQRHHHDAVGHDFPLYRSRDLREWQHIGSFFTNPDPTKLNLGVECGQMIPLADGRYLWDFTHTYLVGRIEQNRFIMQHHGTLGEKGNFVHWGGWERDDSGRLLFQTTKILKLPVPELARLGWGRTHRLPLVAKVDEAGQLTLEPIAELQKLRGRPFNLGELASAHQEAQITFPMPASGQVGLRLGDGENSLDILVDADKHQLVFDPRKLPAEANHVPNDKRLFTQPITAKAGEQITLRVFLDGALVEVFCNDLNRAHWAWFSKPDALVYHLIGHDVGTSTSWHLGSIWSASPRASERE